MFVGIFCFFMLKMVVLCILISIDRKILFNFLISVFVWFRINGILLSYCNCK